MPAGQIIGKVAVRVLPNTDNFRKDVKIKLEKIEKRLKFSVPTTLDMTGAKRDMLIVLRELNAENKTMNSRKIRFHAVVSTDGMRGELAKYRREATLMAKSQPVKIATSLLAAKAEVELDAESLKNVKRQLEHWRRGVDPLKIQATVSLGEASVLTARTRLAFLARNRFVTFIPRVSKVAAAKVGAVLAALSGARMLSSTFENIWDMFKNLDKVIPLVALLGNAVVGLGGALLTAGSNAFALISSLASIGGIGLALPGILGGLAVGMGVAITAFTTFADNVPDVRKALTDLKEAIGKDFWAVAADPIREMANELMPRLGASAKVMGTYFGGLFSALGDTFKTTLIPMFKDFNRSVDIATGGTDGLAGVITKLGVLGAGYLPRLATWFVKITDQFSSFLSKADKDGRLQAWIDNGIVALHDLGDVLRGTFDIFADMGRAAKAAGGSTLGIFADTLARIHKVTASPAFQKGMTQAFSAAHKMMSLIADRSGPAVTKFFTVFAETLTTLLPVIGETLGTALSAVADALAQPEFQSGLVAMFQGIQKGVEGLAPVLPSLGKALGALGETIGVMAEAFGPLLAETLQVIVDVFMELKPALLPLIPILSNSLLTVIKALAKPLADLAIALGPVVAGLGVALADAVTTLAPHLDDIATSLGGAIADALIAITPYIGPLVEGLTDMVVALAPLIPQIVDIAVKLVPFVTLLTDLATKTLPLITDASVKMLGLVITTTARMVDFLIMKTALMLTANAAVAEAFHLPWAKSAREISTNFVVAIAKTNATLGTAATTATTTGVAVGVNFSTGLRSTEPTVLTTAQIIAEATRHALYFDSYAAGKAVGDGFIAGMSVTSNRVVAAAAALAAGADNALTRAFDPDKWVPPSAPAPYKPPPATPRNSTESDSGVTTGVTARNSTVGTTINVGTVVAQDYGSFIDRMDAKTRLAALGLK